MNGQHHDPATLLPSKELPVKVKGKGQPITAQGDPDVEYMYSSTLALTSALDGVGCSMPGLGFVTTW